MSSRVGARLRMAMARARSAVGQGEELQGEELDPAPRTEMCERKGQQAARALAREGDHTRP